MPDKLPFNLSPLAAIAILAVVFFFLAGRRGIELEMADTRPSIISFLTVGLMASGFIVLGKWLFNDHAVPGVTDFFNMI